MKQFFLIFFLSIAFILNAQSDKQTIISLQGEILTPAKIFDYNGGYVLLGSRVNNQTGDEEVFISHLSGSLNNYTISSTKTFLPDIEGLVMITITDAKLVNGKLYIVGFMVYPDPGNSCGSPYLLVINLSDYSSNFKYFPAVEEVFTVEVAANTGNIYIGGYININSTNRGIIMFLYNDLTINQSIITSGDYNGNRIADLKYDINNDVLYATGNISFFSKGMVFFGIFSSDLVNNYSIGYFELSNTTLSGLKILIDGERISENDYEVNNRGIKILASGSSPLNQFESADIIEFETNNNTVSQPYYHKKLYSDNFEIKPKDFMLNNDSITIVGQIIFSQNQQYNLEIITNPYLIYPFNNLEYFSSANSYGTNLFTKYIQSDKKIVDLGEVQDFYNPNTNLFIQEKSILINYNNPTSIIDCFLSSENINTEFLDLYFSTIDMERIDITSLSKDVVIDEISPIIYDICGTSESETNGRLSKIVVSQNSFNEKLEISNINGYYQIIDISGKIIKDGTGTGLIVIDKTKYRKGLYIIRNQNNSLKFII